MTNKKIMLEAIQFEIATTYLTPRTHDSRNDELWLTIVLSEFLPDPGHFPSNLSWHFLCTAVWQPSKELDDI